MSVTAEQSQIAELVVQKSKDEARVDTGRLKRSINKKVQRGIIVFREYFYGGFPERRGRKNSTLEANAKAMMKDISYKIERLNEEGDIVQSETHYGSGRKIASELQKLNRKEKDKKLLESLLLRREQREKDNTSEDN